MNLLLTLFRSRLREEKARPFTVRRLAGCGALLSLALASPALLRAQFQDPTPDELKMTADPKAPGAAAVYLNISEVTNRDDDFVSLYARIKVLTEKGEDLGTVEMPYEKHVFSIADIRARTIEPDGTIVPLVGKPDDLLKSKSKDAQSGRKVFTLPSVQVGSIIEYYYQIRFSADYLPNPYWQIQHRFLVRKAHYQCIGCNGLSNWTVLPVGVTLGKDRLGHPTLDMGDVPPAPDEDWMPPIADFTYKAVFYNRYVRSPDQFWKEEGDYWSRGVDAFVEPSKPFRDTVSGLLAPGDSDLDKAKKLYKAVQALDNTDYSRERSEAERKRLKLKEIQRAEDVWTQRSGTATEIALLYLSMLRAAGLTAYGMRVVDRSERLFIPTYLEWDQLDDTIVLLNVNGKEIVLDPGEKMCPFQTVRWTHSRTGGVRQNATGSSIATTPQQAYGDNTIRRIATLTLDIQGAVDGDVRFAITGQEALYWRQKALLNDEAEVKKQFDNWISTMFPDGVDAHVDHFSALDAADSSLVAVIKAHGNLGTATSKRILIPGLFFETRSNHPFVAQEKRQTPIDMHYGDLVTDDVTYSLPQGVDVESLPQAGKIPWEGHAVMLITAKSAPGQVAVTRTLARSFTFAAIDEYPTLHDFYQKVATADQQQIVLTRAPAAKGE